MKGFLFLCLFGLVFAGFGIVAIFGFLEQGHSGEGQAVWFGVAIAALFVAIGLGIVGAAIWGKGKSKQREALARKHPDEPWRLEKEWVEGRIKDSNLGSFIAFVFFAVIWNGLSWTAAIGAWGEGEIPDKIGPTLLVALFPVVGLGIAFGAVKQGILYFKYGTSVFEMAEVPGALGGTLGGVVFTKVKIRPEDGFRVTLKCIYKYRTGSGKNASTHRTTFWEDSQLVTDDAMPDDPSRSAIPILFDLPYDAKATQKISSRKEYYWELSVAAATAGVDYSASLVVPVFKTDKSNPEQTAKTLRHQSSDTSQTHSAKTSTDAIPGLSIDDSFAEETVYRFHPFRTTKHAIVPLIIGVGLLVGVFFMIREGGFFYVFGSFLALFGLLALGFGLGTFHCSVTIATNRGELRCKRTSFIITTKKQIAASDIESIETKSAFKVGQSEFFDIRLSLANGKAVSLPTRILGRADADRLVARLERDLQQD